MSCRKEGFYSGCCSRGPTGPGEGKMREQLPLLTLDKVLTSQQHQRTREKQAPAQTGVCVRRMGDVSAAGTRPNATPQRMAEGKTLLGRKKASSLLGTEYGRLVWEHRQGCAC